VTGALGLLAGVVATLTVDRAALARSAADPGLVLADLADRIVGQGLGERRSVHQLLGRAARRAAEGHRPLTADDVAGALAEGGVAVPPGLLAGLGDPAAVLAARTVTGGFARLPELLGASGRELGRHRRAGTALRATADGAEAALLAEARRRSGG
jgi:argininosuccinate lyase